MQIFLSSGRLPIGWVLPNEQGHCSAHNFNHSISHRNYAIQEATRAAQLTQPNAGPGAGGH